MKKLAIVTTHPIQYYAPLFRLLSRRERIQIKVFYTWKPEGEQFEPDFGRSIRWDIPLLDGYEYEFVENTSRKPGSNSFSGITNPTLVPAIKSYNPDALLVFGWAYRSHLHAMRYFKGRIPVYFRGDSTLLDARRGVKEVVRRAVLKWVYRYVDKAFYVGEENKRYFQYCGLKEDQLIFAPHAIDNDRFMEDREEYKRVAADLRRDCSIDEQELVVLFVGKFIPKKNPVLLARAFSLLSPEIRRSSALVFVGDGALASELTRTKDEKVHIKPFQNQSDMPGIYRAADLFCLPSQGPGETWGLAVNEAMACGVPVLVSSRTGCARDLVTDNTGWLFESGDVNALAARLSQALGSRDVLAQRGKNAREHVARYSFDRICEAMENELLSL